ncbi:MAG: hypothetical protein ACLFS3_03350 [Candidatus Aenigmatarchaeota archaeon]
MTEYWNENLTEASWKKLQEISQEYDFTLIGGWAAYLWTGKNKSKDIDIIVGFETLERFKQDYEMRKNENLKKYEIKTGKFDIDIYVPYYSDLILPLDDLKTTKIKGIKTLAIEELLILKQDAEIDRGGTVKGRKDKIDILTLLIHGDVDLKRYGEIVERYEISGFKDELKRVIMEFKDEDIKYTGLGFKDFKDWKKEFLSKIKG